MGSLAPGLLVPLIGAALLLAACGSDEPVAAPTPSPTPTPPSIVWAGNVCVDFADVKTAVGALGHNLSYDAAKDANAVEQISKQLRLQVLSIADSADGLLTTLREVPVDFVEANAMVESLTKTGGDTRSAVDTVTGHLDAAQQAGNIVTGAAEVAQAVVAAKAAFEAGQAFVGAIGDATSGAKGKLKEAFDAAPQCAGVIGGT